MTKKSRTNKSKNIINKLLIGGEPKKLLVMCQRRTGTMGMGVYTVDRVEDIIVPKINLLIRNLFDNDNVSIIYLSSIKPSEGTVDVNCELDGVTPCSRRFIIENRNSFDLIILQTCPFIWMDYHILHSLLKPNGMLGATSVPGEILFQDRKYSYLTSIIQHIPQELFELEISDNFYISQNILLFRKIERHGGSNKKKSKRNK